jgi:hypothetical protein
LNDWSMRKALSVLIGSTLCTFSFCVGGHALWKHYRTNKLTDPHYRITSIIQTGPEKEALPTAYLTELLGLSLDHPTSLYALNLEEAEQKLLASPLIARAHCKRLPPSSLYIDYEVRKPIAYLADYQNTAIDADGHLFPAEPFLSPKQLPQLYLGETANRWQIAGPAFDLAKKVLAFLDTAPWTQGFRATRIDVSNAFAPSLGAREIVLFTEEELAHDGAVLTFPKILRLSSKDIEKQLSHFFSLRRAIMTDYEKQIAGACLQDDGRYAPRIIDLRIPQLAFVEK